MKARRQCEAVSFITTEDGDDLIVSFALDDDEPGEVVSLILLRTPKYESLLPENERGVSVSHEVDCEDEDQYLRRIKLAVPVTTIESTGRAYELNISRVDPEEVKADSYTNEFRPTVCSGTRLVRENGAPIGHAA